MNFLKKLTIVLIIFLFFSGKTVVAQSVPRVLINPQSDEIGVGQTLQVLVQIEAVQSLYGYDLSVMIDPQYFSVVDADPDLSGVQVDYGTFLDPGLVVRNQVDSETGLVQIVLSQINPSEPKSGSGVLLVLSLKAKQSGQTQISIKDVLLSNAVGQPITADSVPADIRIREGAVEQNQPTVKVINPDQQIQVSGVIGTEEPVDTPDTIVTQNPQPVVENTTQPEQSYKTQSVAEVEITVEATEKIEVVLETVVPDPTKNTQENSHTPTSTLPSLFILGGFFVVTVVAGIFFWRSRQG